MKSKRFHLIFDLSHCNKRVNDKQAIREFLEGLVKMINMSIIEGPIIAEGLEENPGLSGVIIIDFSHISIHTFTKYDEVLIDVFSCKELNKDFGLDYCLNFFDVNKENARIKEVWWG